MWYAIDLIVPEMMQRTNTRTVQQAIKDDNYLNFYIPMFLHPNNLPPKLLSIDT